MGRRTAENAAWRARPEGRDGGAAHVGPDPAAGGDGLLSPREAADRLGVTPATLYDWLGRSDRGLLVIRGIAVTIDYLQGGAPGQGRIRVERREVERLRETLRVRPSPTPPRRPPVPRDRFPGITVPLGRPGFPG